MLGQSTVQDSTVVTAVDFEHCLRPFVPRRGHHPVRDRGSRLSAGIYVAIHIVQCEKAISSLCMNSILMRCLVTLIDRPLCDVTDDVSCLLQLS